MSLALFLKAAVTPTIMAKEKRLYVLKPGNHQFHPKGPAEHNNSNTDDTALAAYLKTFPHIEQLLIVNNGVRIKKTTK